MISRLIAASAALFMSISPALAAGSLGTSTFGVSGQGGMLARHLSLPNGESATVFPNGLAQIFNKNNHSLETETVQLGSHYDGDAPGQMIGNDGHLISQLMRSKATEPYIGGRVVVAFRTSTSAMHDSMSVPASVLLTVRDALVKHATATTSIPDYTNDHSVNVSLASLGVDSCKRLFRQFSRSILSAIRPSSAANSTRIDLGNVYELHVSGASVPSAVEALARLPQVAYVAPDWTVDSMRAPSTSILSNAIEASEQRSFSLQPVTALRIGSSAMPPNYTLTTSAQSLLNAPSTDTAAAYDEIEQNFHQIPGEGETITDVSVGDLDDPSAISGTDPCDFDVFFYGPTTEIIGGQRYLNLPSMPLIPTFTADDSGNLSGTGEVCGVDPFIGEIGLDFSMMAPLPHDLQRPAERGSGETDLLGIAPGASYRLIVPASFTPAQSDIDAALLAAALQSPRPNVITVSLGFGFDSEGFPSRYLEEDPLAAAIVDSIVNNYDIVVCISSGDGTRTRTNAAIGASGGSVPTDVVVAGGQPTNVNDDRFSTIPSEVFDSGSIDVGGTTLDDIFSNPPQYANDPRLIAQHAYPETRWTGFTAFSSGFGSRVNVSAPSDNLLGFEHKSGGAADAVTPVITGGTSASAPETAAAAAIMLQIARLTGHPFANPRALRQFLEKTSSTIPSVAQADRPLNVGPQINVRVGVEALLAGAGIHRAPRVVRVGVEQRRDYANLDSVFLSDTNPANINVGEDPVTGLPDQLAWITITPDWEYVPESATYRLFVKGHPVSGELATTPWARLLPATILRGAGLSLTSTSSRSVTLTYEVRIGNRLLAQTNIPLTFGPAPASLLTTFAPRVEATESGVTIPVTYDMTNVSNLNNPQLVVSEPGRVNPVTGRIFRPAYTLPLTTTKGTIRIPVARLQGAGIYGIGIELNTPNQVYSDFAYTRVGGDALDRPRAPLLSGGGGVPGHILGIPFGTSFQVQYDVSNISQATGATLEISDGGPGIWGSYNTFSNPNGSTRDKNGVDGGSVYYVPLPGRSGTVTIDPTTVLFPVMYHTLRILPTQMGQPFGEASDVSTLTMNGVASLDGGVQANGWGINLDGSDGFITSTQLTATGEDISSLELFNQTTDQITHPIASASNTIFFDNGWTAYDGSNALFGTDIPRFPIVNMPIPDDFISFNRFNFSSGSIENTWTPPFPIMGINPKNWLVEGGAQHGQGMFLVYLPNKPASDAWNLFTSDIATGTFSPAFDLSKVVPSTGGGIFDGMAENVTTQTAVLTVEYGGGGFCDTPEIVTVNLAGGKVSSIPMAGSGSPLSVGVDSTTNMAAVPTYCDGGYSFYNLGTGSSSEVLLPGVPGAMFPSEFNGFYSTADSNHALFLVVQSFPGDGNANNNALASVLVYNENGTLEANLERFNLDNVFLNINANYLQVNPRTRTGYLFGPLESQLTSFRY